MCSLFGDPHLQRFDGTMQSCTEEGAHPFIDNRHFLIQVTNANIRNEPHTTAVSKVTVLIRSHNCTRSLHYEAASDEETLPISFSDGVTHYNVDDHRTTVEIRAHGDYVEIFMHHIHSSVQIRRRGPYLSVSVVVPESLQGTYSSSESLCTTGCRNQSIIAIDKALAASSQYAKCYARKLYVPIKLAIDRCRTVQVTDQYFDACVFDFMITGDEYLVAMARDAQSDVMTLMSDLRTFHGRQDVNVYKHLENSTFSDCIPSSSDLNCFLTVILISSLIVLCGCH
ncbi:repulsive guidance molecule [Dictyocaulus viviparus]|uniref:Repulsive guidance molecule n=1 Tax=Dictyocaulus viviparus TaxID=29172 RepID=A0A0D8Y9Y5_DICVI|nr:repulsive guidance molecule [Dictyocaulus viviparus]